MRIIVTGDGSLPPLVCVYCRRIQGPGVTWHGGRDLPIDSKLSHGICPACIVLALADRSVVPSMES